MAEWQQTEPPVDREIEFEKDGREREIGILAYGGKGGVGAPGRPRLKTLFMVRDSGRTLFEVTRWRELDDSANNG